MTKTAIPMRPFRVLALAAGFLVPNALAATQITSLVSRDATGQLANADAYDPAISDDGRFVAFFWYQGFALSELFLADRITGALERISVSSNEVAGNGYSYTPSLTPDMRHVAFSSYSTNLVAGDTNGAYPDGHDVFVRDRVAGTTERVSLGALGQQGNGLSYQPAISADARYVAFVSSSTNLVVGDTNGVEDVFVRDRVAGTTERVGVGAGGVQADAACWSPRISADGRFVTFHSASTNLVAGDTNGVEDVFVRDRAAGTTERVSVGTNGAEASGASVSGTITPDARFVAFRSVASDLVPGDANGRSDVFLRDRVLGTTERVSVATGGAEGDGDSTTPSLTPDGRFVAFQSRAANLVAGDTNGRWDCFVRDRVLGTTQRVSVTTGGAQGDADSGIQGPVLSADGQVVAFDSRASLDGGDANAWHDVYVRDRRYVPLDLACAPGQDGVIACPCSNAPSGPARGCDNAVATGGARLSAHGAARLSADTLVFRVDDVGPTAACIVVQGDAFVASGAVFGHGVRCVGGAVRRMYARNAAGGSLQVPDLGAGDASVSARSARLGDALHAGVTRWYAVHYRDPGVLGACSAASTFNATPVGRVVWIP